MIAQLSKGFLVNDFFSWHSGPAAVDLLWKAPGTLSFQTEN